MADLFQIRQASLSDKGLARPNNEDYVTFYEPVEVKDLTESGNLYIVADGVGGAARGESASKYAAEKILYEYYNHPEIDPATRLGMVVRQANADIYQYAQNTPNIRQMATTLVAAVIQRDRLIVANVGDSRAYLIRNGNARQITRDHNLVGEMVRNGTLTEQEALHSKQKNKLTRSVGGEEDVVVDIFEETIQPGDRILLCTDGLTRYTQKEDVSRLAAQGGLEEAVKRTVDFANQNGGGDNITAQLVEVGGPSTYSALTVQARRRPAPVPVSRNMMSTWSGARPLRPPRHQSWVSRNAIYLMGSFAILLFGLIIGLIISRLVFGPINNVSGITPSSEAITVDQKITNTPNSIALQIPTLSFSLSPSDTPTPTLTSTPTITATDTPSATPTPPVSGKISENGALTCSIPTPGPICIYKIKPGDNIYTLIQSGTIPDYCATDSDYFYCEITSHNNTNCKSAKKIENNNKETKNDDLTDGNYLIIPGVKDDCTHPSIPSNLAP